MRPARILRICLTSAAIALLGASWTSCSSGSNGAAGDDAGDDRSAVNLNGDSTVQDAPNCDPCDQVCSCAIGDTLTGLCGTENLTLSCPPQNRVWGGKGFCTSVCVDASGDGAACDPCVKACLCLLGEPPRYDPATCSEVRCKSIGDPTMGTWGPGVFCTTMAACDGGIDAANESGADVIPDAMIEAASD
jgi:hypothetical protein